MQILEMNNNFICITNWQNYYKIIENNIWGVKKYSLNQLHKTSIGDKLLFYIKTGRWQGKKFEPSIFGVYEVAGDIFFDESELFLYDNETFPYRVKIKKIFQINSPKNFRPLIPMLKITKNSIRWGAIFMGKAMIQLDDLDFETILKYLK